MLHYFEKGDLERKAQEKKKKMVERVDHDETKITTLRSSVDHTAISVSMPMEDLVVDWRGRPCNPPKHGGMKAAVFVLGFSLIFLFLYNYISCSLLY